ncbi:hypothetical protein ASG58_21575 [Rhizobium sp. Leaf383]|nr:hypothetical protein ASG58_21575 [Rhizobium sp. Leaf383]
MCFRCSPSLAVRKTLVADYEMIALKGIWVLVFPLPRRCVEIERGELDALDGLPLIVVFGNLLKADRHGDVKQLFALLTKVVRHAQEKLNPFWRYLYQAA